MSRELGEELRCSLRPGSSDGEISAASEIDEVVWLDLHSSDQIELAPLTRVNVLPLAKGAGC